MDAAHLGRLAAGLMELVETEHPDGEIRAALVIVDAQIPDPEDPETNWTVVRWAFGSVADGWEPKRSSTAYAAGICATALDGLTDGDDSAD